jgi:hypothetical protein
MVLRLIVFMGQDCWAEVVPAVYEEHLFISFELGRKIDILGVVMRMAPKLIIIRGCDVLLQT